MEDLVTYITQFPPEDADEKRAHKLPFVACELLCCEVPQLLDKFFSNPTLLESVLSFFASNEKNDTLAGYVSKVCEVLLNRNSSEFLKVMFEQNYSKKVVSYLFNFSVAGLVNKVLCMEDEFLNERINLLKECIAMLKSEDFSCARNASWVVCQLINNQTESNTWKALITTLTQKENLNELFSSLSSNNLKFSAEVLLTLIISPSKELLLSHDESTLSLEDDSAPMMESEEPFHFVKLFVEYLPVMIEVLKKDRGEVILQFGTSVPVLGEERLKVAEIINSAIRLDIKEISVEIVKLGVLEVLVDLFFKHQWNSMMHNVFDSVVNNIMSNENTELQKELIGRLQERLVEAGTQKQEDQPKPGFTGHLVKIGNQLLKYSQTNEEINSLLAKQDKWTEFISDFLVPKNEIEAKNLGGRPTQMFSDGSEEEQPTTFSFSNNFINEIKNKYTQEIEEDERVDDEKLQDEEMTTDELFSFDTDDKASSVLEETNQEFNSVNYWKLGFGNLEDLEEID